MAGMIEWVGFVGLKNNVLALVPHGDEHIVVKQGWRRMSRNGTKGRTNVMLKSFQKRLDAGLRISFEGIAPRKRRTRKRRINSANAVS